jgi:chemotaxis protein MotB
MAPPKSKAERPLIIVKRKGRQAHGHHGGAWKVAYADFVTAMMAFFLVMWLVTAVSKDQRAAIFDYFKNPSMEPGKSPKPSPGQMGPGGASTSPIDLHGGLDAVRTRAAPVVDFGATAAPTPTRSEASADGANPSNTEQAHQAQDDKQASERQQMLEHKQLESLMAELRAAVSKSQALQPFKDQLLLDITPEGVRIQIVDAQNRPMFDVGSARLRDYTSAILRELAPYLNSVPNRISLTGHTDIRPYPSSNGYTNWELSADRANAARRALTAAGLPDSKVSRVVGLSSSVLFDKADPQNPINRRISIVVMTRQAEEDALKTDTANQSASVPEATPTASGATAASAPAEPPVEPSGSTSPPVVPATQPAPVAHAGAPPTAH